MAVSIPPKTAKEASLAGSAPNPPVSSTSSSSSTAQKTGLVFPSSSSAAVNVSGSAGSVLNRPPSRDTSKPKHPAGIAPSIAARVRIIEAAMGGKALDKIIVGVAAAPSSRSRVASISQSLSSALPTGGLDPSIAPPKKRASLDSPPPPLTHTTLTRPIPDGRKKRTIKRFTFLGTMGKLILPPKVSPTISSETPPPPAAIVLAAVPKSPDPNTPPTKPQTYSRAGTPSEISPAETAFAPEPGTSAAATPPAPKQNKLLTWEDSSKTPESDANRRIITAEPTSSYRRYVPLIAAVVVGGFAWAWKAGYLCNFGGRCIQPQ